MLRRPLPAPDTTELSANLQRHVETLAGLIGPRYMEKPSAMEATKDYIQHEFERFGDVVVRETYPVGKRQAQNLVIDRPGVASPEEIIILGAHYDTDPQTPGADDNASAVAALIEVARLLLKEKPRRSIRFVAFANEEQPHFQTNTMGSQIHALACHTKKEKIIAMICLEMVGYFTDAPDSQKYPDLIPATLRKLLPTTGNFLGVVSNMTSTPLLYSIKKGFKRASDFPIVAVPLPETIQDIRRSDHASFWDQGYPAVMITDTSLFRNPHYHMPTDTPDTLNYPSMARVCIGLVGAVMQVAR